ncbi:carbonic anhydrase family protein [Listeria booriae]|uniref:carbonic anhydrase n=1 Tax=Listeria booriae TaxID=1552123 RepID=A0A7X0XYG1_9LIST|nr:carbonic anhydrase family protein [Listeria booriae]MBC1559122.1 carbonic anhydrase family protein [Listeria booriae]MBC1793430.1 carbonic anhydrase family protein [Listeria booriae]MBC1811888.1 carbonic anhydrase family protein [Listeria booriae]MBC2099570.1 carbonic anhydrase family protein [Listeria booriae]MBC2172167.1 carbonic anhydrase family protein [Listeria booriae]
MKKTIIATALVLGIGTLAGCGTQSSDNTTKKDTTPKQETTAKATPNNEKQVLDWSYSGKTGPSNWGDIKPAYAISKTGKAQSPVKIDTTKTKKDAKITNITYKYQPTSFKLIRKDQMIQATAQPAKGRPDSTINVGGKDYTLKTINIHTPAEHQIDNKKMDAELQLVHTSKDNKTVIISVLVKSGAENKAIGDLTSVVANSTNNKEQTLKTTISTLGLIPTNDKHFTYQGSLTTPATTEGVTWFVYETPITMSTKQLDQLKSKLADNNRPTQPLNERVIYSN